MTLPAGWAPPSSWTNDETRVFTTLQSGAMFDARTPAERAAARCTMNVTVQRPVTISGAFLSEIIRKYTDEFPIGVQLQGVAVTGEVALESVRVDKILSLEHCYFTGPIVARGSKFLWVSLTGSVLEDYFDLRSSVISGAVFLRWGFNSLTSTLLRDISVTGPVDCSEAVFKYDALGRIGDFRDAADGESFSLARGTASALFWMNMLDSPTGIVNLRNVQIKSLRDAIPAASDVGNDWPRQGMLRMTGLKYEERTSTQPDALRAWIELQDPRESRYGSYQTAIKTLSESGHELSANEIILAKQRYIAEREQSALTKFLRYMYIWLSKAGIGTDRIALITLAAFLASLIVIYDAARDGGFVPKSFELRKNDCYSLPASSKCTDATGWKNFPDDTNPKFRVPDYYPAFSSIGYTIDLFVPGVSYGVATDWRPESEGLTAVTAVIRVVGSLLFGLLLVCVSGIARFSK